MSALAPIATAPTDGQHVQAYDRNRLAMGEAYYAFKPDSAQTHNIQVPWKLVSGDAYVTPAFWRPSEIVGG